MKLLIGVTGFALFVYLVVHIIGNLMVFFGPEVFNRYAFTLEGNPLIPIIEIGLLLIFLVHVYKTVTMFLANQSARPARYTKKKYAGWPSRKSLASSTMIFSGLWLLLFIVIHVKAFRYGVEYDWPAGGRDLYRLEMENFESPFVVGFYVLSMIVVGSHLWHGISSSLQSLGLDHPRWTPRVLMAGKVFAILIAGGFIVIALWAHLAGARP
jgi:succinate dehydrogenase / fumarate reductase cytochrome b subunit